MSVLRHGAATAAFEGDPLPKASTHRRNKMSGFTEFYRVTLSNGQVIELQADDTAALKKALEGDGKSADVTLPGAGDNKMTIYTEHVVSIEASGLIRRGIGFFEADKGKN
jgi:hypothetical protein